MIGSETNRSVGEICIISFNIYMFIDCNVIVTKAYTKNTIDQ